jgi:hypothetical protein
VAKAHLDTFQVMLPIPLPGTELRKRLERDNRIYPHQDLGWEYYDGNFMLFKPDDPMTPEEMQASPMKIMSRIYRFKYMFMIALNVFSFPYMVFFLHNIKYGWKKWYRPWRQSLIRFGAWITMKKWKSAFKKDDFSKKLQKANERLKNHAN